MFEDKRLYLNRREPGYKDINNALNAAFPEKDSKAAVTAKQIMCQYGLSQKNAYAITKIYGIKIPCGNRTRNVVPYSVTQKKEFKDRIAYLLERKENRS